MQNAKSDEKELGRRRQTSGPKKEGRMGEAEKLAKKWKFDAQTFCVGGEEKDKEERGTFCTVRAGVHSFL